MSKAILFAALLSATFAATAAAQNYNEFSPPILCQRFPISHLTGQAVMIARYPRPFPIRVYTTPPQPPYYNVPPYTVVAPY